MDIKGCPWHKVDGEFCGGPLCCEFYGAICEHFPKDKLPGWAEEAGMDEHDLAKHQAETREFDYDSREDYTNDFVG